ncbi:MAG: hypothetical protein IJ181_10520, partial [Acidaminococcaceae bacterium]|nr:hypothetical protein [Acidaminococcaceae bacterium]
NFDTLLAKIDNYNSVNDNLALGEIQQRAKKLFSKEIPIEILQGENQRISGHATISFKRKDAAVSAETRDNPATLADHGDGFRQGGDP